jgi:hypothetical protein
MFLKIKLEKFCRKLVLKEKEEEKKINKNHQVFFVILF